MMSSSHISRTSAAAFFLLIRIEWTTGHLHTGPFIINSLLGVGLQQEGGTLVSFFVQILQILCPMF